MSTIIFDKKFPYVDAFYPGCPQWQRIKVTDIEKFLKKGKYKNVHISIQQYQEGEKVKGLGGEMQVSPFVIDIDNEDLNKAYNETKGVIDYLINVLKVPTPWPRIWFSGKKGFHLMIHPDILGIKPHTHLHEMCRIGGDHIQAVIGGNSIDQKIYTSRRLLRHPGTKHPDTGLWKTELTYKEFMSMSIPEIQEKAKVKTPHVDDRWHPAVPSQTAVTWWSAIFKHWKNNQELQGMTPRKPIQRINGKIAPCIQYLLDNGAPENGRNHTTYVMAAYFHDQGWTEESTQDQMEKWVDDHYGTEQHKLRERLANTRAVVRVAHDSEYHFSCSSCLAIDSTIACPGKVACEFIAKPEDQDPLEMPIISLYESMHGAYYEREIRVPIHITAVISTPFSIPVSISASCTGPDVESEDSKKHYCSDCKMFPAHKAQKDISSNNRSILKFFGVNDDQVNRHIRASFGVPPKCKMFSYSRPTNSTVYKVEMNPLVDMTMDHPAFRDTKDTSGTGYFIGNEIMGNEKYIATIKAVADPLRQQALCHLITSIEPVQTSIESFDSSSKNLEKLKVFQVKKGQTVLKKFQEIHNDLASNVHNIYGREMLGFAIDLSYHSVLGYYIKNRFFTKGWVEVSVVGDTAQGKSIMIDNIRQHYQLGASISAEGVGKGISYAKLQMGNSWYVSWGYLPQNDKRLLVIDEFSALDPKEFSKMTSARSSGVISCSGAVQQETTMRTRAIYISNPKPRKGYNRGYIRDYDYGFIAMAALYPDPADFRRVDFATALKSGTVSRAVRKKFDSIKIPHKYTTDLCKELVLWAWTREPAQVIFSDDAIKELNAAGDRIVHAFGNDDSLIDSGSQDHKMARLAIAAAARVFSTDKTMQNVLVEKEHVRFVEEIMMESYTSRDMEYDLYCKQHHNHSRATPEAIASVKKYIMDEGRGQYDDIIDFLMESNSISQRDMMEYFGFERNGAQKMLKHLKRHKLLDSRFRKTTVGREVVKELFRKNLKKKTTL